MKNNFARETYSNYLKGNKKSHSSSYNELAGQYAGIVNQPTSADSVADAFTHAGNQPAVGPAQRESGALLSGIGAGIKGSADDERKSKLKRLEEQTAQLLELDGQIKKQGLEEEGQRQKVSQFFKQNTVPIASLSQASLAGDTGAANQLAQGILRNYKQAFQDPSVGDFDHFHNGVIYYENPETGTIEGRNLINLMYQSGIEPIELFGQDAAIVEAGLSPGAKREYEDTEKLMQGKLQEQGLRNQKLSSDISYRGAQMQDLQHRSSPEYGQQAEKEKQAAKVYEFRAKNNTDKIVPEIYSQYSRNSEIVPSIDEFEKLLTSSDLAGSSFLAATKRLVAKQTGNDESILNAKNLGQFYLEWMKQVSSGVLSDRDIIVYSAGFADIEKNRDASITILKRLKGKLTNQNNTFKKQLDLYDQDPGANLQSMDVRAPNQTQDSGEQQGVMVQDPDTGEQQKIPANMLEEAKRRGLVVVQ